jgi:hypothetical protein
MRKPYRIWALVLGPPSWCEHGVASSQPPRGRKEAPRWFRPAAAWGERVGLRGVDAHHLEAHDAVVAGAAVLGAERDLDADDDALGQRPVELLDLGDAEFAQVPLRHRQRGRGEPDVVPEAAAGVLALQHLKFELVAGGAGAGVEQLAAGQAADVFPRGQRAAFGRRPR